jgi:gamma-glutamyltranspeptidase / glutathione hydrolase
VNGAPPLGVVAGGHPATTQAGAEILRIGGNAADAAVGAVAAAMCAEACLTGLGGGGFALVRRPDGVAEVLDFFVSAPGLGRTTGDMAARAHLEPYEVPFRSTTQVFHVGPASCAVPGAALGLTTLNQRHGRLPLSRVLAPAVRLARAGAVVVPQQDYLHDILEGILTREPAAREVFAPKGCLVRAGEVLRSPDLADALETLGSVGASAFTTGSYAERMARYLDARGGLMTLDDLAAYEVIIREPVRADYRGHEILTNPLPSSGGTLIAFTLGLLDRLDMASLDPIERAEALTAALEATDAARAATFDSGRSEPGFADAFLDRAHMDAYAPPPTGRPPGPGNTTHVSVIDAEGLAVSVTLSCGSGSGVVVEGTGIYMNNMMGEEDLNPGGFFTLAPGKRLTSMMAPTVASGRPGPATERLIALGSAGSARLRSAIVQVLVNMLDLCLDAQSAVDASRLHVDGTVVHLEEGMPPEAEAHLRRSGRSVQAWSVKDLYFGGVQVAAGVRRGGEIRFDGGGDARRGGAALVV